MGKKIPHLFEDNIEKKLCSQCKEYRPLDWYASKCDSADNLSNECFACRNIRNKRRYKSDFAFPENVNTLEEMKEFLEKNRNKKER